METVKLTYEIDGDNFNAAGDASTAVKRVLKKLRLPAQIVRRAVVCMYEGEINMVIHADGGVAELEVDEELSVGDYVLTGGELPAAIVVDAVARLVDGVLPAAEVHADESIVTGLLEYPQYTRPRVFEGRAVPDVLLGGDHEEIRKWRLARAFERTLEKRPELLELLKGEEPLDRRDET